MKNILLILGLSVYIIAYAQAQDNTSDAFFNYNSSIELKNKEKLNDSPYSLFGDNTTVLKTDHERNLDHSLKIPLIEDDKTVGIFELNFQTAIATIKNLKGEIVTEQKMSLEDVARFLTIDPHSEKYYSVSPYVYVNNNPLRFIDPTGMDWIEHKKTGDVEWRHDINQDNVPKGYNYIGTEYQGFTVLKYHAYKATDGSAQLGIVMGYKSPNNTGDEYNWIQTISTNAITNDVPEGSPFVDYDRKEGSGGIENYPFYQTPDVVETEKYNAGRTGHDARFSDNPSRKGGRGNFNWNAELTMISKHTEISIGNIFDPANLVRMQTNHVPNATFKYGFSRKNGIVSATPIRVVKPSPFHSQTIGKIR